MSVYAGSYTSSILSFQHDAATGALGDPAVVANLVNPSWLTRHPHLDVFYAVSETADGAVAAFHLDGTPLGTQPSHGSDPCHLAVNPNGSRLVVANYGGGSIAVYPLDAVDGRILPAERVESFGARARAHHVVFHADRAVVTDLGNDMFRLYTLDFSRWAVAHVPTGSGPRHLVFHPDGHAFATAELSSKVLVLDPDLGLLASVNATISAVSENFPSGLTLSPDGRFLYVANRGRDCVTVFAVDGTVLTPLTDAPCGGVWPRDLAFIGDTLYVANERSDSIVAFRLDAGIPTPTGVFGAPKPSRLLAVQSRYDS
ncbi:MAG TPA: lactonase family protein [Candidatus Limnocylindrales bacterium]|nr:lactonase family protein [Candidatus Limnocylindrales bacterium]